MDVYEKIAELSKSDEPAAQIVVRIWRDVTDRRGWRQEHDQFDEDVQCEIVDEWLAIVRGILASPTDGEGRG